jgi:hypothetical protein
MDSTPSLFSYQVRGLLLFSDIRSGQLTISQSIALVWQPRADGYFLADDPQKLVRQGKVARIPFVTGDCDDEGTLFSFSQLNIT